MPFVLLCDWIINKIPEMMGVDTLLSCCVPLRMVSIPLADGSGLCF